MPLKKKPDATKPDDFRTVSIINILVKIIQKTAHEVIYFKKWARNKSSQYGFVKHKSCDLQRDILLSQLDKILINGKVKGMVIFIDMKKAFDSVNRVKIRDCA